MHYYTCITLVTLICACTMEVKIVYYPDTLHCYS